MNKNNCLSLHSVKPKNIIVMKRIKTFIALALCSICLSAYSAGNNTAMPEIELGKTTPKPVTVERNCSTFVSIENKTACNITYKQGEQFKVSITAPEENIDKIKTSVVDDILIVEMEENTFIKETKNVKINIESPSLMYVAVTGAGNITSQTPLETSGKPLLLSVKGSGSLKFKKINCSEIAVGITGSGNAEVSDVKAKSSEIEIKGSGSVELSGMKISKKIEINVLGSGNAAINGSADNVKVNISGSGNVTGKVNCDNVSAIIKGSGDVKFSGDVKSHNTEVTGSGRVTIK